MNYPSLYYVGFMDDGWNILYHCRGPFVNEPELRYPDVWFIESEDAAWELIRLNIKMLL